MMTYAQSGFDEWEILLDAWHPIKFIFYVALAWCTALPKILRTLNRESASVKNAHETCDKPVTINSKRGGKVASRT